MMHPTILLLLAAAAHSATFARFAEQTDAAVPPPPAAEIRAQALAVLQGNARAEHRCVPSGIAMERLESASAVRAVVEGVRTGRSGTAGPPTGAPRAVPPPFSAISSSCGSPTTAFGRSSSTKARR
jgi:hypothetical protein